MIREEVTTGEFRCDDPEAAAWRLASLLDGLAIQVVVLYPERTRRHRTGQDGARPTTEGWR